MRLHKMLWPRLLSDKLGLKADPGPEAKAQRYADIFEGGRGQWIADRAVPSSAFEEDHLIDWFRALCHARLVFLTSTMKTTCGSSDGRTYVGDCSLIFNSLEGTW